MPSANQPTTLFVIDSTSLPALSAQAVAKLELLELAAEQDGILQITAALSQRIGLKSLHIVSSGNSGSLQLGAAQLTLFNLDRYGWELQQWGESLTAEAEIVLHQAAAEGFTQFSEAFLSRLQLLTGAKITLAKAQQPQQSVGF